MKTICIPVFNRKDILQEVFKSLKAADGIEGWTLALSLEPDTKPDSLKIDCPFKAVHISTNACRMGCHMNTFTAATFAHQLGSDFTLYLEDDVIVSRDALLFTDDFNASQYSGIACLRRWHDSQQQDTSLVTNEDHGLLGQGFAWRRELWEKTIRPWWFYYDSSLPGFMWDWSLSYGLSKLGIQQWRPAVNRSRHIGKGGDLNHNGPCHDGQSVKNFVFVP